ncbi:MULTISPECIES: molybdenum cofactor biosynthesis protein MoaE [Reichenbachiella]|uniref:Molybdopterin synthase catalytic subunit n=1 Tax=Reichenbachiella agariperforans TaxID=156994 RepID=A0A1M6KUU8_REIAG|nr:MULTISPECIES: molybdenum cofactor biosynthesis protein MoaE [Reichenbachiella]RJE74366.1 molybdenum cofactor biosynthesis protein MoaE [Reichenbachiella sp. MSK19-1]SHJ62788.1 molybdopterin synthase catalytic subunit [Reichenbachiella agariperforans]
MIEITSKTIRTSELIDYVKESGAGAINVFIGTTRNQTAGKKVIKLDFEAYEPMAVKELQKIADRAVEQWDILSYAIVHRVGIVEIGEEAVVIAVSTPHRKDAFQACEFIIDELKKTVPIWKREVFEDGDVWVAAHP